MAAILQEPRSRSTRKPRRFGIRLRQVRLIPPFNTIPRSLYQRAEPSRQLQSPRGCSPLTRSVMFPLPQLLRGTPSEHLGDDLESLFSSFQHASMPANGAVTPQCQT